MKYTFLLLISIFSISFSLSAQTFSSQNPEYIEKVKAGEAALNEADYAECLSQYEAAFDIKQTSYLSTMRAAACAFKANDEIVLNNYLDKAFELSWDGAKQVFDNYSEFDFLKGTPFEKLVGENYEAAVATSGVNLELMQELAIIHKTDQEQRGLMREVSEKYGWQSPQMDSLWKIQSYSDSVNTQRIEEIIAEYGYPGKSLVGNAQASTAFLVIQHADLAIQEKYLPLISKAADNGEVRWSSVALLVDRVRMRKGEKQIYGSQLNTDQATGKPFFAPIENPHKIDSIRATVGLGPLQSYADHWQLTWDADVHIEFHKKRVEEEKMKEQEEEKNK